MREEILKKWNEVSVVLDVDPMSPIRYAKGIRYIKDIRRDSNILEIGCGNGKGLALLNKLGFSCLSATEVSSDRINRASRLLPDSVKIVPVLPENNLPFPPDQFDVVLAFAVIEHTMHPGKFMEDIFRILRNGGKCIVSSDCFSWGLLEKINLYNTVQPIDKAMTYARFMKIFRGVGFKIEHFDTFNLPQRGNIYIDKFKNMFPKYFFDAGKRWQDNAIEVENQNYSTFFSAIDESVNEGRFYNMLQRLLNLINDENIFLLSKK